MFLNGVCICAGILLLKKLRMILFLPAALFLSAVGWSLIWIDSKRNSRKNVDTDVTDQENSDAVSFQLAQEPIDWLEIEERS